MRLWCGWQPVDFECSAPSTDRASALLSDLLMRALKLVRICLGAVDLQREMFLTAGSWWVGIPADCYGAKATDAPWGRLCRQIFNLLYMLLSPCFSKWKEHTNKASSAFRRGFSTHMGMEWSTNKYHKGGNTITGNTCFLLRDCALKCTTVI